MHTFLLALSFSAMNAFAGSWNGTNNPANLNANYNYSFAQMPTEGAVDAAQMPWSDNYWESDWGGISLRWSSLTVGQRDPDLLEYESIDRASLFQYTSPSLSQLKSMSRDELMKLSPAEKYDILMGRYNYPTVRSERQRTDASIPNWQGICHGWVPASINTPEPLATDLANADGITVPFGSSDVKGLISYYYGVVAYNFARGARKISRHGNTLEVLDQPDLFSPIHWLDLASDIWAYNSRGRSLSTRNLNDSSDCTDASCILANAVPGTVDALNLVGQVGARDSTSDPDAGAFHVVMANQLGLMHKAFAGNLNISGKPNEIWNQPVTSYSSHIDFDHRRNRGGTVGITTKLTFVSEIPQTWDAVVGTANQRFKTMEVSYELEVDSYGNITGGTWTKGIHPNFLWKHEPLKLTGYFGRLNEFPHK